MELPRRDAYDGFGQRNAPSPRRPHASAPDQRAADGNHARTDGYVSLGVIASALLVGLGFDRADPIFGLVITLVILKITRDSWRVITTSEPGDHVH